MGVKPLRSRNLPHHEDMISPVPEVKKKVRRRTATQEPAALPAQSAHRPPPQRVHGTMAGLDRRTAMKLRRGQLPIEARIDLHGMTQIEAHRALGAFLSNQQAAGRRCILVITGKGSGSGGSGVLRAQVPHWLNEGGNRELVLAFDYARPRDGGQGALYVLLKRKR